MKAHLSYELHLQLEIVEKPQPLVQHTDNAAGATGISPTHNLASFGSSFSIMPGRTRTSLTIVALLLAACAYSCSASALSARKLLQTGQGHGTTGAATSDVIAALGQLRAVESGLLKRISNNEPGARDIYLSLLVGLIGCEGSQVSGKAPQTAAMALTATSWQHTEYASFEDLRNTLIESALDQVESSPPSAQQCQQWYQLLQQLNIPQAALGVYGRRLQKTTC